MFGSLFLSVQKYNLYECVDAFDFFLSKQNNLLIRLMPESCSLDTNCIPFGFF